MKQITVANRLRPVRFGFLVRPDRSQSLQRAFEVCTSLWGGKYNPMIPIFARVPRWWDRRGHHFDSASQITNGYLDFFEPDLLVETERGLAEGLGYSANRVLSIDDILPHGAGFDRSGHGQSVFNLFEHLHQTEFQFSRRHPHDIVNVAAKSKRFAPLSACLFGKFPTDSNLQYLDKAFNEAFDPLKVPLDGDALLALFEKGFTSALRMGHHGVEVDYHDHNDPALFVLDALQPRDLIDFWNLRATRREVLPIPVQWLPQLTEFCRRCVARTYRPLPGNPNGVMIRATVMFSRSIPSADIQRLHTEHFRVDVADANVLQDWYPPIWRETPSWVVGNPRPTLTAKEVRTEITVGSGSEDRIRFETLAPEFAARFAGENRWANVIRLEDWTSEDRLALVFPTDSRDPKFPHFGWGREGLIPTTEGLVHIPTFRGMAATWDLTDGTTAVIAWLKTQGIEAVSSSAGRVTQQVIHTLGGFWGVRCIANAETVKYLNEISRRPGHRSAHHQEFRNRIKGFSRGDVWRDRSFEGLVERGAVQLGLELKCTKCANWSWHVLSGLGYEMTCEFCRRGFPFPVIEPSVAGNARWAYRLVGPFALPNFAEGSYAAALALRFFAATLAHHDKAGVTWSGGLELRMQDKRLEADFVLWYQRKQLLKNDLPTDVVFGEAKSFGADAFQADDVDRLKQLALVFPGSILVFATMKTAAELSEAEVSRLRRLAEWGRESIEGRGKSRAPVVVLTAVELFAPRSLSSSWQDASSRHAELIAPAWRSAESLRQLADMTQQLYLSMPSYQEWHEEKWRRHRERRLQDESVIPVSDNE